MPLQFAFGRSRRLAAALAASTALTAVVCTPAFAQTEQADGSAVYPAEWFARYAPTNAWEMAERVPGFTLAESADDTRGFGAAAGNVVINGQRPSAKAETLESLLRRIPAAQVARIELVPGAQIGGEYRSRAQVLNVVLVESADGVSGAVEFALQYPYNHVLTPDGAITLLRRKGDTSLNLALRYDAHRAPDYGYDRLVLPSGDLVERRDKQNEYFREETSAAASWAWTPQDGRSLRVNGRGWRWTNPLRHFSDVSDDAGPLRRDTIMQAPAEEGFELGGDAGRPLAGGTAKVVGLARRWTYTLDEEALSRDLAGDLTGGVSQDVENRYGETVGRVTWAKEGWRGWSIETGLEAAFNTLESDVNVFEIEGDGSSTPIDLPVSDVLVEEVRGEAFVSGGRPLSERLTFDWGLAVEASTLTVSGDAEAERTLVFVKPRASLEWRPTAEWRFRGAIERLVSQLNFNDFISGAEIANNRFNSGNADIEPERTWRLSGVVERKLLGDGTFRVSLYYDHVEMVQDRVPTDVGLDAPGNLGTGRRIWADTVLDLPLAKLGVQDGRFNLRWIIQDSDVEDPYTGRGRYFSGEQPWSINASFRQDLKAWKSAWGIDWFAEGELPQYRLNEIDVWNPENDNIGVFVEHRPTERLTMRLDARNILDRDIVRERTFYLPDRSNPNPAAFEERRRWQGVTWSLQVKRTFG